MPEVREIEAKLAALRQEVAEAKRTGYTPSQIRKLLQECCALWTAVERFKYAEQSDLKSTPH
jgi:predicted ATPase